MSATFAFTTAVAGTGNIAAEHTKGLIAAGLAPVACMDIVPEAAEAFARRFGIPHVFDSFVELLERHSPDIVAITTPPPAHLAMVEAAVAAGVRGINCEKPMATDLATADAMIDLCARAGVLLVVNHQRRFLRQHQQARAWIDAGRIGRVSDVICGVSGDLLHDGTHMIDLLRYYLADQRVTSVLAGINLDGTNFYGTISERWPAGTRYGHLVDSSTISQLLFADGIRAVLEVGYKVARPFTAYTCATIRGEAGAIEVNTPGCGGPGARLTEYGRLATPDEAIGSTAQGAWEVVEAEDEILPFGQSYTRLAECLATGSEDHPLHARSARADLEIIMAIFESCLRLRAINLPFTRRDSPLDELVSRQKCASRVMETA